MPFLSFSQPQGQGVDTPGTPPPPGPRGLSGEPVVAGPGPQLTPAGIATKWRSDHPGFRMETTSAPRVRHRSRRVTILPFLIHGAKRLRRASESPARRRASGGGLSSRLFLHRKNARLERTKARHPFANTQHPPNPHSLLVDPAEPVNKKGSYASREQERNSQASEATLTFQRGLCSAHPPSILYSWTPHLPQARGDPEQRLAAQGPDFSSPPAPLYLSAG